MFWSLPSYVFLCLFWCVWGDEHFSWVKTSKGVHGKMFDGLVFLCAYQGLQYISYSKPSENSQCRNPPLPPVVAAVPTLPPSDEVRTIFISGLPEDVKERELQNLLRWFSGYEALQVNFKGEHPMGFAFFSTPQLAVTILMQREGGCNLPPFSS